MSQYYCVLAIFNISLRSFCQDILYGQTRGDIEFKTNSNMANLKSQIFTCVYLHVTRRRSSDLVLLSTPSLRQAQRVQIVLYTAMRYKMFGGNASVIPLYHIRLGSLRSINVVFGYVSKRVFSFSQFIDLEHLQLRENTHIPQTT